jgi:hypothetical protein
VELKKEHTEHEENGTKVERDTYDDPDTKTRAEEIEIDRNHNRRNGEQRLASRPPTGKRGGGANQITCGCLKAL